MAGASGNAKNIDAGVGFDQRITKSAAEVSS
jgi:hypothetical protein